MDVNLYLSRQYGNPPCWEMAADIYVAEVGRAVTGFKTITSGVREIARTFRLALHKNPDGFAPIAEPVDLCLVLLGRNARLGLHHCGVYWQGGVLHALPDGGLYQDLASIRDTYGLVEFWALQP